MAIKKIEKKVLSADKTHMLAGVAYLPEGKVKGIFHVVHGMAEHIGRYDDFMSKMAEEGYICVGYDHLGHGKTANDASELGYIAAKDGWLLLPMDVCNFGNAMRMEYGAELPYYLMGHSMGSFVVRVAALLYVDPDKLIVMGTGGPNRLTNLGLALIGTVKRFKGDHYVSQLVDRLAFGAYNTRFKQEHSKRSWLTTLPEMREKFKNDPLSGFKFTVSAMEDLLRLNKLANCKKWFAGMRKDLPILLLSGTDDPVGNYGKGVSKVYQKLKASGADVRMKLYDGCRHEILNDACAAEVTADILHFLSEVQEIDTAPKIEAGKN